MTKLLRLLLLFVLAPGVWAQDLVGKTVTIRTAKESVSCVRIENFVPKIAPFDKANPNNCRFKVVPGAEAGTVKFESLTTPGRYLMHRSYQVHLLSNADAPKPELCSSWRIVSPLQGNQGVSLQSLNFPAHHIAVNERKELWIVNSLPKKRDAVFFLDEKAP